MKRVQDICKLKKKHLYFHAYQYPSESLITMVAHIKDSLRYHNLISRVAVKIGT